MGWCAIPHFTSKGSLLVDASRPRRVCKKGRSRAQRVYEKSLLSRIETSEPQMHHGYVDPRLARLLAPLVIFAQAAVAAQPGERPLHDPTPLQDLDLLLPLGADDQFQDPTPDL